MKDITEKDDKGRIKYMYLLLLVDVKTNQVVKHLSVGVSPKFTEKLLDMMADTMTVSTDGMIVQMARVPTDYTLVDALNAGDVRKIAEVLDLDFIVVDGEEGFNPRNN